MTPPVRANGEDGEPQILLDRTTLSNMRPFQLRAALRAAGVSPMETDGSQSSMVERLLRCQKLADGTLATAAEQRDDVHELQKSSSAADEALNSAAATTTDDDDDDDDDAGNEKNDIKTEVESPPTPSTMSPHQKAMNVAAQKDAAAKVQEVAVEASAEYFFEQAMRLHREFAKIEARSGVAALSYFEVAQLFIELGLKLPEEELAETLGRLDPSRTGVRLACSGRASVQLASFVCPAHVSDIPCPLAGALSPPTGAVSFADFEDWWKAYVRGGGNGGGSGGASSNGTTNGTKTKAGAAIAVNKKGGGKKVSLGGALALELAADAAAAAAQAADAVAAAEAAS